MTLDYRLSIAPMMEYTDRHFRYMARLFTRRTLLYTEMVVGTTITYNSGEPLLDRVLDFDASEHPIAVQLGGDEPDVMVEAARVCEDRGYDEINLNVGCPSNRVQRGSFGACLMKEPERVADLLARMRAAVKIPVTVKHRIGVDDLDTYEHMHCFVDTLARADTQVFIIHARKAWLQGLSPAQNRNVPPLRYEDVYRLKRDIPHVQVIINGGVLSLAETEEHLRHVDGVMIGRAAYQDPALLREADERIFQTPPPPRLSEEELLSRYEAYAMARIAEGARPSLVLKHLVGLFKGRPGARRWRQTISRIIQENPATIDLVSIYRDTMARP